jgi:Replication-relaxation
MQTLIEREERTDRILSSLKMLDYLTRSQIQVLHGLGSARNASRVMKQLETEGLVNSFRDNEKVYYLSREGRERVGCQKRRKKTIQARHYIMRNAIYIAFGSPGTWKNEQRIIVKEAGIKIVADAMFKREGRYVIVEVDHTQKMSVNKKKIEKYRKLVELGVFKQPPLFVWITTTEYRRKQLAKVCEGLDVQVFTVRDFI